MRREARGTLEELGVRPRRRWGQHFLCDPNVAGRIVETAGVGPGSAVLEIGPGLGALTEALAARAGTLRLVEIDPVLARRLADRYRGEPSVRVVQGDVLALDVSEVWDTPGPGLVVSNLPYNVSTPVLFRLLEWRAVFPRALLMMQREVADRLVAQPASPGRGILSVLLQTYAEIRIAFPVGPGSFHPRPRVHSAVIDVHWSPTPRVDVRDPARFRAVVRAAFSQRRKTLRNALRGAAPAFADGDAVARLLRSVDVDPRARAETLDLAAFARIANAPDGA